ncbi:unnamed protein product [Gadus morhua 'NCC']
MPPGLHPVLVLVCTKSRYWSALSPGTVLHPVPRLLDLKQPDVELPAVFDPLLIWELNAACQRGTGVTKYPTLHISNRDTGERFRLHGHRLSGNPDDYLRVTVETQLHSSAQDEVHDISAAEAGTDSQETSDGTAQYSPVGAVPILHFQPLMPASATAKEESHSLMDTDLRGVAPLPISCSPRAARTGPIMTGGLVQVLDHGRWTAPMRAATNGLLAKHHGAKAVAPSPGGVTEPGHSGEGRDRDPAETATTTTAEEKGAVKYFYCSTRVFQMYGDEGLKDLRMSFEDFAASPFLARELEAVEERSAVCKKDKGMAKELTWMEFQQSDFFEADRDR